MRGLYIKDIQIFIKHKFYFLLTILLTVMNGYNLSSDVALVPGLMIFFFVTLALTTITYDESDHGWTFLFTMPITRKKYTLEKYSISLIMLLLAIGLSILTIFMLAFMRGAVVNVDVLAFSLVTLFFMGWLYCCLLIPIYFRLGAEKSKMVIIIVMGLIFFFAFLGGSLFRKLGIDLGAILSRFLKTPLWMMVIAGGVATSVATIVSYLVSVKIMEKKEL